nr:MlaA family lipoprotein [Vibrio algivorus]
MGDIKNNYSFSLIFLSSTLMLGCSSTPEKQASTTPNNMITSSEKSTTDHDDGDFFEGFNRLMWDFNFEVLDPYVVRPLSIVYIEWTPWPIHTGLNNFLNNLDEPANAVNNLLMGNGDQAVENFSRFWINSTIGLLGFIDVASMANISSTSREFGDVVGHYGVGNGAYLMLPAYGPVTVRDAADTIDGLYIPLNWLTFWQKAGKWAFQGLESRYELISQEGLLRNSPDPYKLSKSIYIQHQDFKAEISKQPEPALDEDLLEEYLGHDY